MWLKKLLVVSSLVLSINEVSAATASGNLNLSGTISEAVALIVTPTANATNLNLSSNASDVSIASVAESSNAANGYRILARSTNGSKLVHNADSSMQLGYTIKYGASAAITLTTTDAVVKTQNVGANYVGVNSAVSISYSAGTTLKAGTYTDTITFTVEGL